MARFWDALWAEDDEDEKEIDVVEPMVRTWLVKGKVPRVDLELEAASGTLLSAGLDGLVFNHTGAFAVDVGAVAVRSSAQTRCVLEMPSTRALRASARRAQILS